MRDGYVARIGGKEYEASPDGENVRLYLPAAPGDHSGGGDGFEEVKPGRRVRIVKASEVDDLSYVRTVCLWRDEPFVVLAEHDSWYRVEYTGGKAPTARALGLEEFDFGVYQGWAPKSEVTELREIRV